MTAKQRRMLKITVALLSAVPALVLGWRTGQGRLGPDPLGDLVRVTGRWALAFLILSLMPTALRILFGMRAGLVVRRILGLYAFGYALAHFVIYAGLGFRLRWDLLSETIRQSPFILAGLGALLLLLPLALTSTEGWVRRLGRNWRRLHRLVYVATLFAVWHFAWAFKELRALPLAVGLGVLFLLALRIPGVAERLRPRSEPIDEW
ncbi:MAG: sulfoxide reductase heme-binding subunit YedZ [Chloroflexi bacterium]|nr:sulfoxide reductase heme-binding subunit YedZ [Chloroflexota bacterium]